MSRRYPPELHDFMRAFIPGHTAKEISEAVADRFGIEMTPQMVKRYKQNRKIRSRTKGGLPTGTPSATFPAKIGEYIRRNHVGVGPTEMTERLNRLFGTAYAPRQLKAYYKNHRINSGLSGRFPKGHNPYNKGRKGMQMHPNAVATQFQKGHTPANKTPIGTVLMKDDGYLWKKVGEGARDWRQLHRLIWEEAHGEIPKGHMITFKDGNRENVVPENLEIITRAEHMTLTRKNLRTNDKALTESGILVARLTCVIAEKKKGKKENANDKQ